MKSEDEGRAGAGPRRTSDDEIRNLTPKGTADRDFRVGLFLIIGVVSFMAVLYLMTEPALFRGRYVVETVVDDARGIRRGDPVQLLGVNVGRVADFELLPGGDSVAVLLEIEGRYRVPMGSTALFEATSALGGIVIRIEPTGSTEEVPTGARIPGRRGADLMASLQSAGVEAEATFEQVQALLSDSAIASIQGSAEAMRTLLTNMDRVITEQGREVSELTTTLRAAVDEIVAAAPAGEDVDRVLARADSALLTLTNTSELLGTASASLGNVLAGLERGEGTLGLILRDESLYRNLNAALQSVEALTTDLRENPGRYLTIKIF